jgi:hypothetical protein
MADAPDDFRLLPPEGHSREELSQLLKPPPTFQPPPEIAARPQFTVADVLVVMVGVAVGLAGATWMRPDYFAAVMGLVTLVGLLAVHLWPPESHLGKLIWATIVMAYVMAVLTALLKPAVA